MSQKTFRDANVGDSIKYSTPQGQTGRGKVVMKFNTHLVLGKKNGQPKCVDDNNFVSMRKANG